MKRGAPFKYLLQAVTDLPRGLQMEHREPGQKSQGEPGCYGSGPMISALFGASSPQRLGARCTTKLRTQARDSHLAKTVCGRGDAGVLKKSTEDGSLQYGDDSETWHGGAEHRLGCREVSKNLGPEAQVKQCRQSDRAPAGGRRPGAGPVPMGYG
jgi:hypothetical protein